MKYTHDDYEPLVWWLKKALRDHYIPERPSAFCGRIFTSANAVAMECQTWEIADVVAEVLRAFPDVVERMNRAEAADPTEFNCPVCGKPVRRCNAVATPFGGAVCLPCANDKPPMPRLPELGK